MSPAEMESDKVVEMEVEAAAADPEEECTASGGDPKACAECNTTKTPLWRGGPNGPKTLCNACGIRYRKRRRVAMGLDPEAKRKPKRDDAIKAAAAAAAAAATTDAEASTQEEEEEKEKAGDDSKASTKKTAKTTTKTTTTHTVELHMVGFAKDAVLKQRRRMRMRMRRRKPLCLGEEERAAMLLMSLSSGVIYA